MARRKGSTRGRRLYQVLPRAEWDRLIDAAGEDRSQPLLAARDQAIIAVFLFSGIRCSELCALDVPDVEQTEHPDGVAWRLQIRHGKGDKHRIPALGAGGADFLEAYLDVRPDCDLLEAGRRRRPLFVSRKGGRLDESAVWRIVRSAGSRIGYPQLHPHDLRHAFATEAVRNASRKGKSIFDVAEQLGHADLDTTRIYYAVSDQDRQDLVADL